MKVIDQNSFLIKASFVHGNKFDYSSSIYSGYKKSIIIICKIHGSWNSTPSRHLSGKKSGCPKCHPKASLHYDNFIDRCSIIHNNFYNYSKVIFSNLRSKIIITCPNHGEFEQKALSHLQGHGCQKCSFIDKSLSFEDFVKKAKEKHLNKYSYLKYDEERKRVFIICSQHGIFTQNKFNHLNGMGCQLCAREKDKLSLEDFIKISNKIHNFKYDYSKSFYLKSNININIICKNHGPFSQLPIHHMRGSGCPSCAKTISKLENEWLDSLGIPKEQRQINLKINGRLFRLDAYNPDTNTIYEFYGDFWHGNPRVYNSTLINVATKTTFGELYNKTIEKENFLIKNGYRVISIWESDFLLKKEINEDRV